MSINPQFLNLGQQMKERRENLGFSLHQVFEETKISVNTLRAIEEGQHSQFPVYAYLRGFIVSYAQMMEMDSTTLLKDLESGWLQSEKKVLSELEQARNTSSKKDSINKKFYLTPVILASSCLFILFCGLIFYSWLRQSDTVVDINHQADSVSDKEEITKSEKTLATNSMIDEESSLLAPGLLQNNIELEVIVKALEEVTFSYRVDKKITRKMSLKRDQFEVFKAKEKIWIKTDKADRIRIFHNGDDKGIFGLSGEKEQAFFLNEREPSSLSSEE